MQEATGIVPRVDIVFFTLMMDPEIRLDFLNAILQPSTPIVETKIEDSVQGVDRLEDRTLVVDVLATDANGSSFHVEMQNWNHTGIRQRILYDWACLYRLKAGQGFTGKWYLVGGRSGNPYAGAAEMEKNLPDSGMAAEWMWFFSDAENWPTLPLALRRPPMEKAMSVLEHFKMNSTLAREYHRRKVQQMIQHSEREAREQALAAAARYQQRAAQAKEEAEQAKEEAAQFKLEAIRREEEAEQAKEEAAQFKLEAIRREEENQRIEAAKQQAEAEAHRLRTLLQSLGIDPTR